MKKRLFLQGLTAAVALAFSGLSAPLATAADPEPFKIGLVLPMTGPFASTGRQIDAGIRTYLAHHGDEVAGRKIQIILKDDAGVPANTKKLSQELIVNDKVDTIAGFGLTPLALAPAPLATQSKTPMIVMAAQTRSITDASPFIVRTSGTIPQVTSGVVQWATKQGLKNGITLVSDYAPGYESETAFKEFFTKGGGEVVDEIRVPMKNPDFAPFLQKIRDQKPDTLFVMLPSGVGVAMIKQYEQRGLGSAGIKLIGHGAITDDDNLNDAGDAALGLITSDFYSTAHPSELNKKFVADYKKQDPTSRPNFFGVAGYDGMHILFQALEKTNGKGKGEELVEAMKGLSFESPRGPVTLDPETRDFIQNIYLRKVEDVDGELYNVEFDVIENIDAFGNVK